MAVLCYSPIATSDAPNAPDNGPSSVAKTSDIEKSLSEISTRVVTADLEIAEGDSAVAIAKRGNSRPIRRTHTIL